MPKKVLPMNPAVAQVAVRRGKTMFMAAIGEIAALKGKEPCIMQFVPVAEPKPKCRFNRNRTGKFYAEIVSAQEIATDK